MSNQEEWPHTLGTNKLNVIILDFKFNAIIGHDILEYKLPNTNYQYYISHAFKMNNTKGTTVTTIPYHWIISTR